MNITAVTTSVTSTVILKTPSFGPLSNQARGVGGSISLAKFFLKDHTVNIFALLAILASVTTTQLCCCSTKEASNDM